MTGLEFLFLSKTAAQKKIVVMKIENGYDDRVLESIAPIGYKIRNRRHRR